MLHVLHKWLCGKLIQTRSFLSIKIKYDLNGIMNVPVFSSLSLHAIPEIFPKLPSSWLFPGERSLFSSKKCALMAMLKISQSPPPPLPSPLEICLLRWCRMIDWQMWDRRREWWAVASCACLWKRLCSHEAEVDHLLGKQAKWVLCCVCWNDRHRFLCLYCSFLFFFLFGLHVHLQLGSLFSRAFLLTVQSLREWINGLIKLIVVMKHS